MRDRINAIGKMFYSTFLIYSQLDTSLKQSKYLHIPDEDRTLMKMFYRTYNMKRYCNSYGVFEGMVINHSLNRNIIPIVSAQELCEESNLEKLNDE